MSQKHEPSAGTSDSFEAMLREAARTSHVGRGAPPLPRGTKLASGRFEIVRRIGEGGMGVVYEAFDAERRSKVALKTLSRLDAAGVYRLKNEFRALAGVSHPNLVRLHELFADEGQWFFSMDLVDGVRFDAWVRPDGALNEARLRAALPELLRAVLAIHAAGKLHRDLKPSNVLVTREGRVVVLDFGLAVDPELGGIGQTVADASVSGTPGYMAPEQAAGHPATAASDLYALGVMLFEALTGRLPFEGNVGEMLAAKQTRAAPPVLESCPEAPADLAEVSAALLTLDPSLRLGGAAWLAQLDVEPAPSVSATARPSQAPPAAVELVGRETELAALHDAYAAARDGEKPVIVLLSGESGIGKSALLERFLSGLRAEGRAVVLSGRCYERESVPFKGFDALIDELSRYLRKLNPLEAAGMMPREVSALLRLFPVLGRIDAIAQAPDRTVADPFELRRRGFLALGELLTRIRDRQPLVLAIDDLQWSDRDSTALFLHLVRQADAPRVLLIASHRSEGMRENPVIAPLYETLEVDLRLDVRQLSVGPLQTDAATALVRNLGDAAPALVREAGGNPFLLGELARAGSAMHGRSLAQILRARAAELPRPERALLEVLAVAARPLPLELAAAAAEVSAQARPAFDTLRSAQLARSAVQSGAVECYHDRVREAVAEGLGAEVARAYHAALAQALLQTADPDPEHLSEHFEHAGDAQQAGQYAVQAADRAMQGFAFDQAARLYGKAHALAAFEPTETHRLRVANADALANAGHGATAAEAYVRAAEGASEAEIARLTALAAAQYLMSGRLAHGLELTAQALEWYGLSLPRTPARAVAMLLLERTRLWIRGLEFATREPEPKARERIAALDQIVRALAAADPLSAAAINPRVLRLALDAGDVELGISRLLLEITNRTLGLGGERQAPVLVRRAQTLLEKSPNPRLEAWQDYHLSAYEMRRPDGNLEEALRRTDRFLAYTQANPQLVSIHHPALAQFGRISVLYALGRYAEITRDLPALLDEAWQRSDLVLIPLLTPYAVVAWVATGAEAEAERALARAERAWSALENPYSYPDTLFHMARLALLAYRRDLRAAWDACLAHHAPFLASSTSKAPFLAVMVHAARGATAAALATETTSASERQALIKEAEHVPPVLRSRTATLSRDLPVLRAAVACAKRDRDRAVQLLREANAGPPTTTFPPSQAHAVRRRLGVLLGGDEGKALVAESDAFFREGGVVDPERLVAVLVGGCEIR